MALGSSRKRATGSVAEHPVGQNHHIVASAEQLVSWVRRGLVELAGDLHWVSLIIYWGKLRKKLGKVLLVSEK